MTSPWTSTGSPSRMGPAFLLGAIVATGPLARAIPPGLADTVPAENVAVLFNAGSSPDGRGGDLRATFDVAASVLSRVSGVGLLSGVNTETRVWIELLVSLPVVLKHPHALVLMDISATPLPDGGHKLAGLRAALIIDAGGPDPAIDQRIQHFLSTFTNEEEATLSRDDRPEGMIYSLRDRRLPAWAVIQWSRLEHFYLVTIGEGTMAEVLRTMGDRSCSLGAHEWFAGAFAALDGDAASVALYLKLDALYRVGDRRFAAKIDAVRAALNLDGTEQGLWTLRYRTGGCEKGFSHQREEGFSHERDSRQCAVEITGFLGHSEINALQPIATARFPTGMSADIVPEEATGYTVVAGGPRRLFHGLCDAYLATRSGDNQAKSRAFWRGIEHQANVTLDRDIFPQLDSPIVIHNHPKHLLRFPFAWTVLTRVTGDAEVLRGHIDKLLEATASTCFTTVVPNLRRHPDGVWSIDLGISGPALGVTDEWLVLGYSPRAVRENMARLQALHRAPLEREATTVLRPTERQPPPSP